jgi:hypothetical protein
MNAVIKNITNGSDKELGELSVNVEKMLSHMIIFFTLIIRCFDYFGGARIAQWYSPGLQAG